MHVRYHTNILTDTHTRTHCHGYMHHRIQLKNGVLDCYSDAVKQKLLSRYYLATVMYAYQVRY